MSSEAETLPSFLTPDDEESAAEGLLRSDVALLLLRLALGAVVAAHGAQTLFGWWGGSGRDGREALLTEAGFPHADVLTWVSGGAEAVGGVGLALGVLTPLAGAAVIGMMINAWALKWGFEWHGPFFPERGSTGVQLELVLGVGAAVVALVGPGRLSVDGFVPGLRRDPLAFSVTGLAIGVLAGAGILFWRAYG